MQDRQLVAGFRTVAWMAAGARQVSSDPRSVSFGCLQLLCYFFFRRSTSASNAALRVCQLVNASIAFSSDPPAASASATRFFCFDTLAAALRSLPMRSTSDSAARSSGCLHFTEFRSLTQYYTMLAVIFEFIPYLAVFQIFGYDSLALGGGFGSFGIVEYLESGKCRLVGFRKR